MSEQFSSNSILDHLTLTNPFINGDAINDKEDVENKQVNDIILKVNAARKSKVDDNTARMQSIKQLGV